MTKCGEPELCSGRVEAKSMPTRSRRTEKQARTARRGVVKVSTGIMQPVKLSASKCVILQTKLNANDKLAYAA